MGKYITLPDPIETIEYKSDIVVKICSNIEKEIAYKPINMPSPEKKPINSFSHKQASINF